MLAGRRKAQFTYDELSDLLCESNHSFDDLSPYLGPEAMPTAYGLIVELVLALLASWKFRHLDRVATFPLLLLELLTKPPSVPCDRRKAIAAKWLLGCDVCLESPLSDFAFKTRLKFKAMIVVVVETGTVPLPLFIHLEIWRAQLPFETQCVEGLNSLLQEMARRARYLKVPLAATRMCIKGGDPIAVEECQRLHGLTLQEMENTRRGDRFLPISSWTDTPEPSKVELCEHRRDPRHYSMGGFTRPVYNIVGLTSKFVWAFGDLSVFRSPSGKCTCFVAAWSHYSMTFYGHIAVEWVDRVAVGKLIVPVIIDKLPDILMSKGVAGAVRPGLDDDGVAPRGRAAPTVLPIMRMVANWQGRQDCKLDLAAAVVCDVTWKRPERTERTAGGVVEEAGDGGVGADDGDAGGDVLSDRPLSALAYTSPNRAPYLKN